MGSNLLSYLLERNYLQIYENYKILTIELERRLMGLNILQKHYFDKQYTNYQFMFIN